MQDRTNTTRCPAGHEQAPDARFCGVCGAIIAAPAVTPDVPAEPIPTPPGRTRRHRPLAAAGAILAASAALAGVLLAATSGKSDEDPASPPVKSASAAPAAEAATVDVTPFLPQFHDEISRLIAPRDGGPAALLVASSPRQDSPRPVTFTLLEWGRAVYAVADQVTIDCRYLEQLVVDEDQAMFLGCGGGASAHWAWALLPDRLNIEVLPAGAEDPLAGWVVTSFTTSPRGGQPDDLTLYAKRCEPSCAEGTIDSYSLVWDATFRHWRVSACTPQGQAPIQYESGPNGSIVDLTYNGCPAPLRPLDDPSSVTDLAGE